MSKEQSVPCSIRNMARDEISRINELDVTETGTIVYQWFHGQVRAVPEIWQRPSRSKEQWAGIAVQIRMILDEGGVAFGAFNESRVVGFAALRYQLAEGIAQLQSLWVSKAFRRRGVATALTRRIIREAQQVGARAIYVSACPSEAAYSFYHRQGFRAAAFVHRDLYDREPEDIHMVKPLGPMDTPLVDWMCVPETGGDHER